MNNLLVRRSRRLWAPPGTVEQQLDGSAVDDVEPHDIATTVAADLECRRIKYEGILERQAKPSGERVFAVWPSPEFG